MSRAAPQSDSAGPSAVDTAGAADPVRRRGWRWRLRWALRIGFVAFLIGVCVVGLDGLFYYPSTTQYYTPKTFGLPYEEVFFKTSDNLTLHGWFLPAISTEPRGTVIHFHGNAANITNHVAVVTWIPPEGYNVLVFDYRGYGRSEGKVTRPGTVIDGHAALDYLLTRPDLDPQRLFVFGQSLGGAVATVVAAERPEIRAVALDATFASYRRIGAMHLQKMLFWRGLCDGISGLVLSDDYEPIDYVARISPRPLLVIASEEDQICFADAGKALYDAAAEPKQWILLEEGAHLEAVFDDVDGIQAKILEFFASAGSTPESAPAPPAD